MIGSKRTNEMERTDWNFVNNFANKGDRDVHIVYQMNKRFKLEDV